VIYLLTFALHSLQVFHGETAGRWAQPEQTFSIGEDGFVTEEFSGFTDDADNTDNADDTDDTDNADDTDDVDDTDDADADDADDVNDVNNAENADDTDNAVDTDDAENAKNADYCSAPSPYHVTWPISRLPDPINFIYMQHPLSTVLKSNTPTRINYKRQIG